MKPRYADASVIRTRWAEWLKIALVERGLTPNDLGRELAKAREAKIGWHSEDDGARPSRGAYARLVEHWLGERRPAKTVSDQNAFRAGQVLYELGVPWASGLCALGACGYRYAEMALLDALDSPEMRRAISAYLLATAYDLPNASKYEAFAVSADAAEPDREAARNMGIAARKSAFYKLTEANKVLVPRLEDAWVAWRRDGVPRRHGLLGLGARIAQEAKNKTGLHDDLVQHVLTAVSQAWAIAHGEIMPAIPLDQQAALAAFLKEKTANE